MVKVAPTFRSPRAGRSKKVFSAASQARRAFRLPQRQIPLVGQFDDVAASLPRHMAA